MSSLDVVQGAVLCWQCSFSKAELLHNAYYMQQVVVSWEWPCRWSIVEAQSSCFMLHATCFWSTLSLCYIISMRTQRCQIRHIYPRSCNVTSISYLLTTKHIRQACKYVEHDTYLNANMQVISTTNKWVIWAIDDALVFQKVCTLD